MVPPISHKVPRVSWYSGSCRCLPLSSTRLSLSLAGFPKTILLAFSSLMQSITPRCTHHGLGSFPFARRYSGNRCFFLFLRLLRCFSSPGSLRNTMYSCYDDGPQRPPGFPIQISMDQCLFAAPHGFSQLTTSFFGSWYQGIHPTLLLA